MEKHIRAVLVAISVMLVLAVVARADEQPRREGQISAFYVGALEPMPALLGAGVYQQVGEMWRAGFGLGTNALGYTNAITYSVGAQYLLAPTRMISPVVGVAFASGEMKPGDRQNIVYVSTGVELVRTDGVLIGFGVNWSLTQYNGQNMVLPFLHLGSSY